MRIDKYLWCVRYFKTRNLASLKVKSGKVLVNGKAVKTSREIFPEDVINFEKDDFYFQIKVLDIPESRVSAKMVALYCKDETSMEELTRRERIKLDRSVQRKKGEGRPTKKERRSLDEYNEEWDT